MCHVHVDGSTGLTEVLEAQVKGKHHPVDVYDVSPLEVGGGRAWPRPALASAEGAADLPAEPVPEKRCKSSRRQPSLLLSPQAGAAAPGMVTPLVGRQEVMEQVCNHVCSNGVIWPLMPFVYGLRQCS